jgi:hypothetical protein
MMVQRQLCVIPASIERTVSQQVSCLAGVYIYIYIYGDSMYLRFTVIKLVRRSKFHKTPGYETI